MIMMFTLKFYVIDILSMDKVLEHTRQTYGGNWPLAFGDYLREGIVTQRKSDSFSSLLQMEDPLHYLHSAYAKRLEIPKYMINASGDDFFVPDNSRLYFDQLPGIKALRVAPNPKPPPIEPSVTHLASETTLLAKFWAILLVDFSVSFKSLFASLTFLSKSCKFFKDFSRCLFNACAPPADA